MSNEVRRPLQIPRRAMKAQGKNPSCDRWSLGRALSPPSDVPWSYVTRIHL